MTASAFTKFDPRAFPESEERREAAAKAAKPAKVFDGLDPTLATLATLAAHGPQNENQDAGNSTTADYCRFGKYRKSEPTPAKVAKAAKVEPSDTTVELISWGEAQEERAAIVEHDGGAPRSWAEALARLDPARPPDDVPLRRWVQFIDDCGRFVDEGWADRASALGWGPYDLFGCDRDKPYARIDRAGLLWSLNGQMLLALTANAAAIATASGGSLTFRRCPNEPGRVLAWELPLDTVQKNRE